MSKEWVVEAAGLEKSFPGTKGRIEVLRGVDLTVAPGEVVAVMGASGVGKSTLLHILGSLDRPDRGSVKVKGRDVFSLRAAELNALRNRVLGFVFQFHFLMPEFTARENVMMPQLLGGVGMAEAGRKAESLLELVGLAGRLDHKPGELSGGEQQRVAVARALANDPEVVFADEPTGNLDDKASEELHKLIKSLGEERGKAFVIVSHKSDVTRYAHRVLLLEEGILRKVD